MEPIISKVDKELQKTVDPRFKETEFLIEADNFSRFALWQEWHGKVLWEQDSGVIYTIGEFGGEPVCVEFSWNFINGHRVCFYHPTSQVVNWIMVREWVEKICYPLWCNGTRFAHTNAMNFVHCMQYVGWEPNVWHLRCKEGCQALQGLEQREYSSL